MNSKDIRFANFQRLVNRVIKELLWTECLCYLDNILVYGRAFEEHNRTFERI